MWRQGRMHLHVHLALRVPHRFALSWVSAAACGNRMVAVQGILNFQQEQGHCLGNCIDPNAKAPFQQHIQPEWQTAGRKDDCSVCCLTCDATLSSLWFASNTQQAVDPTLQKR